MSALKKDIEESDELKVDFSKIAKIAEKCNDVIPVVVQNIHSGEVIFLAYTNKEAMEVCIKDRLLTLWSTSRNELWKKGKTLGEFFRVIKIYVNCEQNSLLYKVLPLAGRGVCHTKNESGHPRNCFYRCLNFDTGKLENIDP